VGAVTGSSLGLVALLLGALFNAWLNRCRDDRLRREDQHAVATALRTELEGLRRTLNDNTETVKQEGYLKPGEQINVPDLAQSIRIMPEMVSKLGLLDEPAVDPSKRKLEIYIVGHELVVPRVGCPPTPEYSLRE
jgi:hypothetical protein